MKTRLSHVSVFQTAKTVALLYAAIGIVYVPIGFLADSASPEGQSLGIAWLFMPIIMWIMGFIAIGIGAALYNWIAGLTGGIEVEFTNVPDA